MLSSLSISTRELNHSSETHSAPVSSIFNVNRARITFAKLNDTKTGAVASPVFLSATTGLATEGIPLVADAVTWIEIRIQSEQCCNTTVYNLQVARRAPSSDPNLANIEFLYNYVNNTGALASAWVVPENANQLNLRQNFSTTENVFNVRTFHGYYYQAAVLPPNTTTITYVSFPFLPCLFTYTHIHSFSLASSQSPPTHNAPYNMRTGSAPAYPPAPSSTVAP